MKKIFLVIISLSLSIFSEGQKIVRAVTGSCGVSANSGTTQINYTVGEAMVSYLTSSGSSNFTLSEGFQQRDTNSGPVSIRKISNSFLKTNFKISPNPANQIIKINYDIETTGTINFNIYNSVGQLCLTINEGICLSGTNENTIDIKDLVVGTYILSVSYSYSDAVFVKNLPLIIVK